MTIGILLIVPNRQKFHLLSINLSSSNIMIYELNKLILVLMITQMLIVVPVKFSERKKVDKMYPHAQSHNHFLNFGKFLGEDTIFPDIVIGLI